MDDIRHTIGHIEGVHDVTEIRVRWLGHRMHAEVDDRSVVESAERVHADTGDVDGPHLGAARRSSLLARGRKA